MSQIVENIESGRKTVYYINEQGQKHGQCIKYDLTGKVYNVTNWVNDIKEGEERIYHRDGQLGWKYNWRNGKLYGDYKEWFQYGGLRLHMVYDDEGSYEIVYQSPVSRNLMC